MLNATYQQNREDHMRLLRADDVTDRVGYSRMHLWRLEKDGLFPRRVKVGPHRVGWLEHEVDEWISERAAERDAATTAMT